MPRKLCLLFSLFLLATCFYHLANWPIAGTDTDLWYHLNGGRYFYETGSVARTSFFSFIEPQRLWVNYYWLFQVVVYQVFSWSLNNNYPVTFKAGAWHLPCIMILDNITIYMCKQLAMFLNKAGKVLGGGIEVNKRNSIQVVDAFLQESVKETGSLLYIPPAGGVLRGLLGSPFSSLSFSTGCNSPVVLSQSLET